MEKKDLSQPVILNLIQDPYNVKSHQNGFRIRSGMTQKKQSSSVLSLGSRNWIFGTNPNMRQGILTCLTLVMGLTLSVPALADSCAGGAGQTVTGVDGKIYCRSNISMNWWSAFAWCEAAGKTLVSLEDCNGQNGNVSGTAQCPNFAGVGPSNWYWTSSVPNASGAYYVNLSSGAVASYSYYRSNNAYALCK